MRQSQQQCKNYLYYRYYTESDPEDGHRLISLSVNHVFGGAEVAFPAYWTEPEVMNSLEHSKSKQRNE